MTEKWNLDQLNFLQDDEHSVALPDAVYKVLIADDDEEIHVVTKLLLRDFVLDGHRLEFYDAYSGAQTIEIIQQEPDIAVILLDVVMEENYSGLQVVEHIRDTLGNQMVRIVLRTGQPGEAPEELVIEKYDINDYRLKTELTVKRLKTTMYAVLRNYRDLRKIHHHRMGLERIIETSANLFKHNDITDFLTSILEQLATFYANDNDLVYVHNPQQNGGFVAYERNKTPMIIAATGKFESYIGKNVLDEPDLAHVAQIMHADTSPGTHVIPVDNGFCVYSSGLNRMNNLIFIEGDREHFDFDLVNLFLTNYAVALDNYMLSNEVATTQKEIIITLGEVVEKHFNEIGSHVDRISEMMARFAKCHDCQHGECEMLRVASTMHDVGKIAIPDSILKKPSSLTPGEFEVVKRHCQVGYDILNHSELNILKLAAEVALNHHEKFDGSGYPNGLAGKDIPVSARMMAIIDVFDSLMHRRVYKHAWSVEHALLYMEQQKGKHFDPELVDLFMAHYDEIAVV